MSDRVRYFTNTEEGHVVIVGWQCDPNGVELSELFTTAEFRARFPNLWRDVYGNAMYELVDEETGEVRRLNLEPTVEQRRTAEKREFDTRIMAGLPEALRASEATGNMTKALNNLMRAERAKIKGNR